MTGLGGRISSSKVFKGYTFKNVIPPMDCHREVVVGLACLSDPKSYTRGPPTLERSRGRDQTKSSPGKK